MKRLLPLLLALLLTACSQAPAATTAETEPLTTPVITGGRTVTFEKLAFDLPGDLEKSYDVFEDRRGEGTDSAWSLQLSDRMNGGPLAYLQFMLYPVENLEDTRANNDLLMADDAAVLQHLTSANASVSVRLVEYGKRQIAGQYEGWYYNYWCAVGDEAESHRGRINFLVGQELYWIEYSTEQEDETLWPLLDAIIATVRPGQE